MQRISEAVVDKVRLEAQSIVSEAKEEAKKELEKAKSQREAKLKAEKRRLLNDAQEEAARIMAQSAIQTHQKMAAAKASVVEDIVAQAQAGLKKTSAKPELLARLIDDAINGLETDKATISVSPGDIAMVKELVKNDKRLSSMVLDVTGCDCSGGVIVNSEDKKTSVDNTYSTRIEMLLPRLLPEISKELFQ
jgi:vacuolar-type H+-ATPase subunit E/Vma4